MTTFYDRDTIRITEQWLSVDGRRYQINQLVNLRKTRGPADRIAKRAACTPALPLAMLLTIGSRIPPSAVLVTIGLFVALPFALALLRVRLRPATYLLWADYYGSPVQLYQTRDATEFGKIGRALLRACTHARHNTTPVRSPRLAKSGQRRR